MTALTPQEKNNRVRSLIYVGDQKNITTTDTTTREVLEDNGLRQGYTSWVRSRRVVFSGMGGKITVILVENIH